VKRLGVVLVAVFSLLAGATLAGADDIPATPPADLHSCTLPGKAPYWFDYADGAVPFWRLFAQPGTIAAVPNLGLPAQIRALGGQTVYFDLYLKKRIGIPSAPVDPSLIEARAAKFFIYVENSTHCSNSVIAENELFGASLPTPWSPTNTQYRANVLRFLTKLHDLGGKPWLLVNSTPATDGEAGDWWRSVAQVANIAREVYFPAPLIYRQGPIQGSRTLRQAFRRAILNFTSIGIPTSKLGIFVGFQTKRGAGGREGLEPANAWFRTVKWQALAARYVANEMKFNSIWSWGWPEYKAVPGEIDPDKRRAACVYLWTRNPKLCNGPAAAGKGFNASRGEGQLTLAAGVRCTIAGVGSVRWSTIRALRALTGDDELAFSDSYARALEAQAAPVGTKDVLAAERSIVRARFGGSRSAYLGAIADAKTSLGVARGVIADELRRARIASRFSVGAPSAADVAEYQENYGDTRARLVQARQTAPWLGGRKVGYALESNAPGTLMGLPTRRWTSVWSAGGPVRVRPLGPPRPLASLPLPTVRPSIRAALVAQAQDARYPSWIAARQSRSFWSATCWRDEFPAPGGVDLTEYLPFLELTA
jgi:hypothetical protein